MDSATATRQSLDGEILERFEDYVFTVTAQSETHIAFEVSIMAGEEIPSRIWTYRSGDSQQFTTDFSKAERCLSGSIKWDGCSNWDFHTEGCMAHFCGRKDATSIGRLLDRLYDIAASRVAKFDRELAG